jgi:hypothetical protein
MVSDMVVKVSQTFGVGRNAANRAPGTHFDCRCLSDFDNRGQLSFRKSVRVFASEMIFKPSATLVDRAGVFGASPGFAMTGFMCHPLSATAEQLFCSVALWVSADVGLQILK